MNDTATLETQEQLTREQVNVEQLPMLMGRKLPTAPFPCKYVLSVFVDLQDARQAANALLAAGFNERDIHILQGHEFVKSVTQDQSPFEIITSIDYDIYLREAHRQRTFLAVRPGSYAKTSIRIVTAGCPPGSIRLRRIFHWLIRVKQGNRQRLFWLRLMKGLGLLSYSTCP